MPQAWVFVNLLLVSLWLWVCKRSWINNEPPKRLAAGAMALLLAEHAFIRMVNELVSLLNSTP